MSARGSAALLLHRTASSDLLVGAAMDHEILVAGGQVVTETESFPDWARTTMTVLLEPGADLTIVKVLAYGWSGGRSLPAVRDQVAAALAAARHTGWDGLVEDQRRYLDDFWRQADLEVEGDDEIQQAARFCLFHTLQASARAEQRPIAAKGLTGDGYDGHAFWDTEIYVLGMLTYTLPEAVADALRWRQAILEKARRRARQLGLDGAAFPWRTIAGEECSAYWPAGTAAFHVNADVAFAVDRYVGATGDDEFEQTTGVELLVETARLWCSLGFHADDGFHLDGVTGPDEYTAVVDDNLYTNLMARQNLRAAALALRRQDGLAAALGVDEEEIRAWLRAADEMAIPYNAELGVHEQDAGFTRRQRWDFHSTAPEQYPLMLHVPYFDLYRKQVVKQADAVLAMYLCGEAFTPEERRRGFEYYEALTVRDSSLSAAIQSVVAADVGHLDLAYDYLREASLMDLRDLEHNTADGLHLAALAGSWLCLVCGFGGMRQRSGRLVFDPKLPEPLTRLVCNLRFRNRHLRVVLGRDEASFEVVEGGPLAIEVAGEEVMLPAGSPVRRKIPPAERRPRPAQPEGREPAPRRG